MIINNVISLAPESPYRKDAEGTLKYTLFLKYEIPELDKEENAIEEIIKNCENCCSALFQDNPKSSNDLYFFGRPMIINLLDDINNQKNWGNKLISMILQHCVMSSYHTILTELLYEKKITGYQLCNQVKNQGFHYLLNSGNLHLNNTATFSFHSSSSNRNLSSNAGSFIRTTQTHINSLSNVLSLFVVDDSELEDVSKPNFRYSLQFSNLFYRICSLRASVWKNLSHSTDLSKFNKDAALDIIEKATIIMEPRISFPIKIPEKAFTDFHSDIVDGLYSYYLTERLFNFSLFYGLLRNIEKFDREKYYNFHQEDIIKVLCCCKKMPNIFSRQFFLEYAFSQFDLHPNSYNDYWHDNDLSRSGIHAESTRQMPQGFHFAKWLQQYELFMNYMAEFIIPIYEWCFLLILIETIERTYPSASHTEHLLKAVDLLADYMKKNSSSIFQPFSSSLDSDMVNIAVKHKNTSILKNLPDKTIQQVMGEFFSFNRESISSEQNRINNIDLNLKHLCPEFFTTDRSRNALDTNYSRIRKFYIDLVRYTYLEP